MVNLIRLCQHNYLDGLFSTTTTTWLLQDPWKYPVNPYHDPDRISQNFHFSHRTVRIDFSKFCQTAVAVIPDRNQANYINPSPVPDKNSREAGFEPINSCTCGNHSTSLTIRLTRIYLHSISLDHIQSSTGWCYIITECYTSLVFLLSWMNESRFKLNFFCKR